MHGHLAVVQWLSENRPEGCSTNAMDWAAKEGKLVRMQSVQFFELILSVARKATSAPKPELPGEKRVCSIKPPTPFAVRCRRRSCNGCTATARKDAPRPPAIGQQETATPTSCPGCYPNDWSVTALERLIGRPRTATRRPLLSWKRSESDDWYFDVHF